MTIQICLLQRTSQGTAARRTIGWLVSAAIGICFFGFPADTLSAGVRNPDPVAIATPSKSAPAVTSWLYRAIGAGITITLIEVAQLSGEPLASIPFVTSIVLTFGMSQTDAAQPYAVVAGHSLSTLAGFAALWCLGAGATPAAVGGRLGRAINVIGTSHAPASRYRRLSGDPLGIAARLGPKTGADRGRAAGASCQAVVLAARTCCCAPRITRGNA